MEEISVIWFIDMLKIMMAEEFVATYQKEETYVDVKFSDGQQFRVSVEKIA